MLLLFAFAEERRQEGEAVDIVGGLRLAKIREGGEDVGLEEDEVADLAGRDLPRPAHQEGNAQSAFVKVALAAAKLHASFWMDLLGP